MHDTFVPLTCKVTLGTGFRRARKLNDYDFKKKKAALLKKHKFVFQMIYENWYFFVCETYVGRNDGPCIVLRRNEESTIDLLLKAARM